MLLVLLGFVQQSAAWWCNGHMLVAMVAQNDLLKRNPGVLDIANGILEPLNGDLTHNTASSFVETACWPDDLKAYGFNEFDSAHFIDRPINPQGFSNATGSDVNVVWALQNLANTLKAQTVLTAPLETSMALRFMIHFYGDIHQPLHDSTYWSSRFPSGDQGGNLFPIIFNSNISNLHALWDSCMGVLDNDLVRPLNESSWETMQDWAESIMNEHTRDDLIVELRVTDVNTISIETYLKAVDYAYTDISIGGAPSQEYLSSRWQVVQRQIALGGYRLADALISILSPKTAESI